MKKSLLLTFLIMLSLCISAQEVTQWKNLKFEESSPQDAINSLGKPKKDKIEDAKYQISISTNIKNQLNFRRLYFQNIDNFKEIYLLFLNNKLYGMDFVPRKKTLLATDLSELYKSDFLFLEGIAKGMKFSDYEGQKETTVPKVYPPGYFMLAVKPECYIIAKIDNNSWKAVWRDATKKPTIEMFPGYVSSIQIISRGFEQN